MPEKNGRRVLIVIASSAFDDAQFSKIRSKMEEAQIGIQVASTVLDNALGLQGMIVKPDLLIDTANPADYAGVIFIGGHGCSQYWHDVYAHKIVREMDRRGGLIAAIGRAPVTLGTAGILKDRRTTASVSVYEKMIIYSGEFTGKKLEIDQNLITADGNAALNAFAETIVAWFQREPQPA